MSDIISYDNCESIKRDAEQLLRYVRTQFNQEETAKICGVSTFEVGDVCGTSKHPDRKRNIYHVETALKIVRRYEVNKDKSVVIDKNPDTKLKPWDVVKPKKDIA